jgi:hypothetical protein
LTSTEDEFLKEIHTKVRGVFLFAIHYSLLLCTVKMKEGKHDRKPYPLPYGLGNPYKNLKSENSQDYAQKPQ